MLLTRDLKTLVDSVVPDTNAGKLNLKSARQVSHAPEITKKMGLLKELFWGGVAFRFWRAGG